MRKFLLFFALISAFLGFSQIPINQPTDYELCGLDGFAEFDLTIKTPEILGGLAAADYEVTYHLFQVDADTNTNPLASPFTSFVNPQTIYVRVFENATGNLGFTTFDLIVNPSPSYPWTFNLDLCDIGIQDGIGTFDLTIYQEEFNSAEPNIELSYYESYQDAESGVNAIADPTSYTNSTPFSQDIYIRTENVITGCYFVNTAPALILSVGPLDIANDPTPFIGCDSDGDGVFTFNLDSKTQEILGNNSPNFNFVSYHETLGDAEMGLNALPNNYTNIVPFSQTIYARVYRAGGCFQTVTLDLVVDVDCVSAFSVDTFICVDNLNTPVTYDLTSHEAQMVNGLNPVDFTFSYYMSETNALSENNAISNPEAYTIVPPNPAIIYVRIENASGSFTIVEILIEFILSPQVDFNGPYIICDGNEVVLFPFVSGNNGINGTYEYIWSTGETSPEIIVNIGGTYTVTVNDIFSGCSSSASVEVIEGGIAPVLNDAQDLSSCDPNENFDLTVTLTEILNGVDPSLFEIGFFDSFDNASLNVNQITNETNYSPFSSDVTIYVRVQNLNDQCFNITSFNVNIEASCPIIVDCDANPVNTSYCYNINDATPYVYQSSNGLPLQVNFVAGQVEMGWDELVVLDSDGITNINPEATTYGNDGNLAGLSFTSSGDSITVYVDSDEIYSCTSENYIPIDYNVSCLDPNTVPECSSLLITPNNGDVDVNETTNLSWTSASGVVNGYKLSVGITSGGTEILNQVDVGNTLNYDLDILDYEVTYYITIIPYNDNGDGENCEEFSFTTRANPNQIVSCDDGLVNTTYCYDNNDTSEFSFQSSDGLPLTLVFNAGGAEVNFDEIYVIDSDGSVLNPNLPYGNSGDFTGLSYTSSGDSISVQFDTDGSVSCVNNSSCCTAQFDFDVFCSSSVGIIDINAFIDENSNSAFDANEVNFSTGYFTYEVNGDGMINTVNSSTGHFQIVSFNDTDVYEIVFNLYEESAGCYDVVIPVFSNLSVTEGNTVSVDFPVIEEQNCEDLAVYLINYWTPPRPGFSHENFLVLENLGFTTITSGTVEFVVDPQLVFNAVTSVNPNYSITTTATGFTVDFVNLAPGDVEYIDISLTCPATVALDDIVTNTASYLTSTNDLVPGNNLSTLSEVVVGSWDPNDKMEAHGPRVLFDEFSTSDEWLYYTIRFQNEGTFPATFVRIEDELDASLDAASFQMLRASHDYVVTRTETSLEWFFDDINLPAEQDDPEGSNGFVYFRIKPTSGYGIGDIIPNTAAIYFDFNVPIITNRFETEFVDESLSLDEFDIIGFEMYPNPANTHVNIKLSDSIDAAIRIIDIQGKIVKDINLENQSNIRIDVSDLQSGLYFVKLNTANTTQIKKLIKQ